MAARRLPISCAALLTLAAILSCRRAELPQRMYPTAEDAVGALRAAVAEGDLIELVEIFGPDANSLLDTADPVAARQRRDVFTAAMAEGWRLVDEGPGKVLVIGNEGWPFPVPLERTAFGWRFDTAAGRAEVIARRIGRNELAVIDICERYVAAQRAYASAGRDGQPPGIYAQRIASDAGRHNGLYWPAARGERRSPLGDLIAEAEPAPDAGAASRTPFHGYYYRILTAQGAAAPGGARSYVVDGAMAGGFALIAWPAHYDVTGIMTFVVGHDGVVYEKDLGRRTAAAVETITGYDPDSSWRPVRNPVPPQK
jgi:hypothetical protein